MIANAPQHKSIDWVWNVLSEIPDPEIPVINIVELGIVRTVVYQDNLLVVYITPTYSGCPATKVIKETIEQKLSVSGLSPFEVKQQISPAWSSEWISDVGREKLRKFGIAPPNFDESSERTGVPKACPICAGESLEKISEFSSTPCKALWRCKDCLEPFDYFKCI